MTTKPIHHLVLTNGDHLIATISKKGKTTLTLESPFIIDEHKDQETGQVSMLLNQYLYSNEDAIISKNHVMVSIPVEETVEKYYRTYVEFNREIVEKNKVHDMTRVTHLLEKSLEAERNSIVGNSNLVIFKEVIDSRQLFIPSSNTIN
jgi:hypothetical protein